MPRIDLSPVSRLAIHGCLPAMVLPAISWEHLVQSRALKSFAAPDPKTIRALEAQGNRCGDWSKVLVESGADLSRIRHCEFGGRVAIASAAHLHGDGQAAERFGAHFAGRMENARLCECFIGGGATVVDVGMADRLWIGAGAALFRCGHLSGDRGEHCFGLDREIVFAPGTGGRQLPVIPEVPFGLLSELARLAPHAESLRDYKTACAEFRDTNRTAFSFIGRDSVLFAVERLERSFVGEGALLEGVGLVSDSVLNSTKTHPLHARQVPQIVRTTADEGCEFGSGASTENAHFCEASFARENARVYSSIVAPNSGVLGGELKYSMLGPFTGFNHQALCIATFWPGGKGNVSYGANVGSNHTGKAADQENWSGEGVFYGLGSSIKFPCNTFEAPYTVFATGVSALPQKLSFPFSLVNTPSIQHPRLSPAVMEIFPGWMINNNLWGLLRSELKFASRNKARKEALETRVFRAELLPMVLMSERRLEACGRQSPEFTLEGGERIYTDRQLSELGKNFLTESSRLAGIEAYQLAREVISAFDELAMPDESTLTAERRAEIRTLLARVEAVARDNKRRDALRGQRIIPDYEAIHDDDDEEIYLNLRARAKVLDA